MRKLLPFLLLAVSLFAQQNTVTLEQHLDQEPPINKAITNTPAPLGADKKHELFDLRAAVNEDVKKIEKSSVMGQLNKDQAAAKKAQDALNDSAEYKAAKKANDAVDADVAKVKESAEWKALQAKQDTLKKAIDAAAGSVDLKKWQLDQDFDWVPVTPVQSTQEKK
jgi:hypothetical protein